VDALDLARWQFGITTVYHFLFVPITIGLSALVAGLQTAWVRTGKEHYLRATKFWGKLFLINFAMGVVTGIVQEFQFGMNCIGRRLTCTDAAQPLPWRTSGAPPAENSRSIACLVRSSPEGIRWV